MSSFLHDDRVAARWPDVVTVPTGQSRMRVAVAAAALDPAARRLGIRVLYPDGRVQGSQDPQAPLLLLHQPDAVFRRMAAAGLIGFGESYQAGEWKADNLPALLARMATRADRSQLLRSPLPLPGRARSSRAPVSGAEGGRPGMNCQGDLSNELFALMLGETMTYSSALFEQDADGGPVAGAALLADAQRRKIDRVLDIAGVGEGTRLLEIGAGWGETAIAAARRGAHVHAITDSPGQRDLAQERITQAGMGTRIRLELYGWEEVRPPVGAGYDAIICVEMIEAIDEKQWPAFLRALERNIARGGRIVLQAVTMRHDHLAATRGRYTWIQKYVRSRGQIPSVTAVEEICHQHTGLSVEDLGAFGAHYAETFAAWRERFSNNSDTVAALGYDEIFERTWSLYLAFRQASFTTGHLDVHHLILRPAGGQPDRGHTAGEPEQDSDAAADPAALASEPDRVHDGHDVAAAGAPAGEAGDGPAGMPISRWATLGGQVHFADYGGPPGAPTLVCVHGIGGSGTTWAPIAPRLARGCQVLAVDLAGFGGSKGSGLPASVRANQMLLHQFLVEVVGGPAVVMGHSMGGTIAAMLASHHPEVVSGLILIDPAVPWVRDELDRRLAAARSTLTHAFRTGTWPTGAQAQADQDADGQAPGAGPVLTARILEQYLAAARTGTWSRGADADLLAAGRSLAAVLLRRREFAAMLAGITVPVLWLHGDRDPAVPVGAARDIASLIPACQFHVAQDVGHEPHAEVPDWADDHISTWLGQLGEDTAG